MLGISLVTVLVAFDQTVVGTALPVMVAELKGFALYAWVATGYLLLSSIFVPIMGRLGDLFGRKPFVLASIVIFTGASALCGLAQSMVELVLARALQGVGGGMLVGTAFAATADIFPDQMRRIKWQAMLSSAFGLANAIGPPLGGWLTEHWGWRSVFYVNLPVGLAALVVVGRYLPRGQAHKTGKTSLDWTGALLLAVSIATFLLALESAARDGPRALASLTFWAEAVGALGSFVYFLRVEARAPEPVLPLPLFKRGAVRLLSWIAVLSGWSMFTLVFYAPLLLEAGFGVPPRSTGLIVAPLVVCISLGSIVNGRLHGRVRDAHRLLALGVCLFLSGCLAVLAVGAADPPGRLAWAFALAGLGLGFQLPNLTIQAQAAVERRDVGVATALVQTLRMLGSMVGAALGASIVSVVYRRAIAQAVDAKGGSADLLARFSDPQVLMSDRHSLPGDPAQVAALLRAGQHALVAGVHDAVWLSAALCVIALAVALKVPPMKTS